VTGGAVFSHQDSTFLFTTPYQSCLGLWLALDDATLANGCLWVRPGSHCEAVRRQYRRNPCALFGKTQENDREVEEDKATRGRTSTSSADDNGEESTNNTNKDSGVQTPKFIMQQLLLDEDLASIAWDGELPGDGSVHELLRAGFIPLECRAGDLLAFCGTLDHLSLPNVSDQPRHTYQLHLIEGPKANVKWSKQNWLQYPDGKTFVRLLKEEPLQSTTTGDEDSSQATSTAALL
jgi:phytanoyl-CoA hydroxylase